MALSWAAPVWHLGAKSAGQKVAGMGMFHTRKRLLVQRDLC